MRSQTVSILVAARPRPLLDHHRPSLLEDALSMGVGRKSRSLATPCGCRLALAHMRLTKPGSSGSSAAIVEVSG